MIEVRNKRIPLQRCKRPIIYKDALRNAQGISSATCMMRAPTGMEMVDVVCYRYFRVSFYCINLQKVRKYW